MSPWPPYSLGKNRTLFRTQCRLSQKKFTITDVNLDSKVTSESTQDIQYHNVEAIKLLIIKTQLLKYTLGETLIKFFAPPFCFIYIFTVFVNSILIPQVNPKRYKPSYFPGESICQFNLLQPIPQPRGFTFSIIYFGRGDLTKFWTVLTKIFMSSFF